jgi:2,3-dihydroxyphenylpropionate 1,2-dioxygenase
MIVGAVCLSHSPLMDRKRAKPETEARFESALNQARLFISDAKPDLTIVFFPDHLNGFFYDQMPCFCVGIQAESIGDFGTVPGSLDIPEALAIDCAAFCMRAEIDVSISHRMKVDHGAAQPLEILSGATRLSRVLPIFVNCVVHPRPSFGRAKALGRAVGDWASQRPERILIIGSGGLSHDPPLPALASATPEMKARLMGGMPYTHADRAARQARSLGAGYGQPGTNLRPLNPAWDQQVLDAFVQGNANFFDELSDDAITHTAGSGAHELRTWVAALAAAQSEIPPTIRVLFYESVLEWITGMGILTAQPGAR